MKHFVVNNAEDKLKKKIHAISVSSREHKAAKDTANYAQSNMNDEADVRILNISSKTTLKTNSKRKYILFPFEAGSLRLQKIYQNYAQSNMNDEADVRISSIAGTKQIPLWVHLNFFTSSGD